MTRPAGADMVDLHDVAGRIWDAIIIGTGMGGGTVGRALAEAGLSVLFVEKGPAGDAAADHALDDRTEVPEMRLRSGYWPERVAATVNGEERRFFAPLGAGVGGSSRFYAATLERPEPHDLDDTAGVPHPTGGWPVSHDEMAPWLARAERMYSVRGEPDPRTGAGHESLFPPLALDAAEAALIDELRGRGLSPYRLHLALREVEGCRSCLGSACPLVCKMDGRSAGVMPALATGRAALLERCEVTRLCAGAGGITHVEARRGDVTVTLRARVHILAAGALASPRLLMASASEAWPAGLANASGMVGRNLMFHLNEMFALWPGRGTPAFRRPTRAVGFRDLYHVGGERFGMVQSMGVAASRGVILHFLRQKLAQSPYRRVPGSRQLARIPATVMAGLLGEAQVFVGLLEDMPHPENRVLWQPDDGDMIRLTYAIGPEMEARRRRFRRLIRGALKGQRHLFLTRRPEPNFGHPCGTLRFGTDPATSVLDAECRAHGVPNLYVADASFMPTSMGVNPSLTIAANALRVGDAVMRRMRAGGHP